MNKQLIIKSFAIEKEKINIAKRQVTIQFFQAYEPDLHGDVMYPEEIANALDSYMAKWQLVGRMHKEVTKNYPVRVYQDEFGGGWVTLQIVEDDDWTGITNGTYKGGSWAGMANSTPLANSNNLLSQVEFIEASLVDRPAVQSAVIKSEDSGPLDSLVQQAMAGKVKPRVRASKSVSSQLTEALAGLIQKFLHDPTEGGGNPTTEDDDMGMTPEEKAVMDGLQKSVESLTATVEGLTKQLEAGKPEDKPAEETKAESVDIAKAVADGIAAGIKPLADQVTKLAGDIAAIGKQGAPSHAINSDGSNGGGQGQGKRYGWKK